MTPPEALLSDSTRLSLNAFNAEFTAAWSRLAKRFLKLECWQEYQEIQAAASQEAYNRGDPSLARELLRGEAESDQPLYEDVRRRGIDYARLRLVKLPLTPYLEYEMTAYSIRAEMGENIEVTEIPGGVGLPSADYFDFLLFDSAVALIHDYGCGAVGVQSGGWLVRDPKVISTLEGIALGIRAHAMPVGDFSAARKADQAGRDDARLGM
jgi:hypothetical protein